MKYNSEKINSHEALLLTNQQASILNSYQHNHSVWFNFPHNFLSIVSSASIELFFFLSFSINWTGFTFSCTHNNWIRWKRIFLMPLRMILILETNVNSIELEQTDSVMHIEKCEDHSALHWLMCCIRVGVIQRCWLSIHLFARFDTSFRFMSNEFHFSICVCLDMHFHKRIEAQIST